MPRISVFILAVSFFFSAGANAQLVDDLIGQKRSHAQVLLRPYRILDYKKERVVHSVMDGVLQTVLFKNDSVETFYWAVSSAHIAAFEKKLETAGYHFGADGRWKKGTVHLVVQSLQNGGQVYAAAVTDNQRTPSAPDTDSGTSSGRPAKTESSDLDSGEGKPDENCTRVDRHTELPLMQQALLKEQVDDTTERIRPPSLRNPEKQWIAPRFGKLSIMGWEQ